MITQHDQVDFIQEIQGWLQNQYRQFIKLTGEGKKSDYLKILTKHLAKLIIYFLLKVLAIRNRKNFLNMVENLSQLND